MNKALRKRDMTVTEDPRQAKIVWAVNTMTDEEVGKTGQENQVKAGSLNGPWGRIAEIVSNAAVSGIQELFGIESIKSS
jgi:L,D-peptidoglycan transpeptidase YkuD (ErfK/YbiS/YcfS/YnhG family)